MKQKGYYVKGQFVAEGSELDMQLKDEQIGSRAQAKRESDELQKLGEALLTLPASALAKLDLPEKLVDALAEHKRISNFEGKRRQMQFIGKLMRKIDADPVRQAVLESKKGSASATLALHRAEKWRDDLIADEDALKRFTEQFAPLNEEGDERYDLTQLRQLIRQARKDIVPDAGAGVAQRQGKAYREIFQMVKTILSP
jgi:ribosome-associated protein